MIAKLVAAAVIYWLFKPRPESVAGVTIGDDYSVNFVPTGDGRPWSDAYKTKPGDPP